MGPRLSGFVEKVPLFHDLRFSLPEAKTCLKQIWVFRSGAIYSILVLAMTKRKPGKFSVTKAVKANARERVGQPKPVRVVQDEPRTGRQAKHKPKLEELIRQGE